MELNLTQANDLIGKQQIAHRMSVAFYQRLLPSLRNLTESMELEFWQWKPIITDRPSGRTTSPVENWAWDLLPLFASRHVYCEVAGGHAQAGDLAVAFDIYIDDAFKAEKRKAQGVRGEPDPLKLQAANAVVEMRLFRCTAAGTEVFRAYWDKAKWPTEESVDWHAAGPCIEAQLLTRSLAEFIAQPQIIAADLRRAFESEQLPGLGVTATMSAEGPN